MQMVMILRKGYTMKSTCLGLVDGNAGNGSQQKTDNQQLITSSHMLFCMVTTPHQWAAFNIAETFLPYRCS